MPQAATYYRNRIPINDIEPDTLWVSCSDERIKLVDADQYHEESLDARFYQVTQPVGLHPEELE